MDKTKQIEPCQEYWRLYHEYIEIVDRLGEENAGAIMARKELDDHRRECVICQL